MKLHLFVTLCWAILYTNYHLVQADEADNNAITESQPLAEETRNSNDGSMNVDNDSDSKDSEEENEKDDNEEDESVDEATNESEDSETDEDEDEEGTESDEKETEIDEENKEETNAVQPKEKITKETVLAPVPAPVVTNGMSTSSANNNNKNNNKQPTETIVTSIETKEGMEAPPSGNGGDSDGSNDASDVKNVIGSSVDATTALLKQTITDITAINISMDAWRNQTWANKSPREVVDLLETEFNNMYHDRYVHVVFISMGITSILFTLYVVQQIFEHPQGMVAKFCRCSVACIRILFCPVYTILCCPCCGSRHNKKNRPNASKYAHVPAEEDEEDPKKQ